MDEQEEFNGNNDELDEENESNLSENEENEDNEDIEQDDNLNIDDVNNDDDNDDDDDDDDDDENDDEIFKDETDETDETNNTNKFSTYKPSFIFNDDLETNDSNEFLQKFSKESKFDYISSNHQESLSKNLDEIKDLINVIRDKDNIIIDELHKTIPLLTKYEKTKILGIRLKQLNNGSLPYININEDIVDNFIIAEKELIQKKIPFIIQRPISNNTFEYWKLQDLEIL